MFPHSHLALQLEFVLQILQVAVPQDVRLILYGGGEQERGWGMETQQLPQRIETAPCDLSLQPPCLRMGPPTRDR